MKEIPGFTPVSAVSSPKHLFKQLSLSLSGLQYGVNNIDQTCNDYSKRIYVGCLEAVLQMRRVVALNILTTTVKTRQK